VNVIPFPRSQGRALFLFSHRPEWPHARQQYYGDWFHNCLVNASVALLTARHCGIAIAHAVPGRGCDPSSDLIKPGSGLSILRHESVFTFTYPSLFRNDLLREFLTTEGISRIFMVGFPANDVALASAIDACSHGYRLTVVRDCSPLVALPNVSVAVADQVTFGSVATFCQVENFGDRLPHVLPREDCDRAGHREAPVDVEALLFFLYHLADQADGLGHGACAQKIRQAASDLFPVEQECGELRSE
jgi:nicotinamidase-related amidase